MNLNKIIKILLLNIGIVILNIIFFSPGFFNFQIDVTDAFKTALGITIMFLSVVIFFYGNYKIITQQEKVIQSHDIKNISDCISVLKQNYFKRTFSRDIGTILEQIERFNKKKGTVNDILLQKFNSKEISYLKFQGVINNVEELIFINIKSILNKLNAFDEEEYKGINKKSDLSKEFIEMKKDIYEEYISFIRDSIKDNEEILFKIDKFILEITKFNSLEDGEIENLQQMKEIDELTKKVKFYK